MAVAELTRWPHERPPRRSQLDVVFRKARLTPSWWQNAAGDVYGAHSHAYRKMLFCANGGITFRIEPAGPDYELRPGDRLDIPAGTSHSAIVGREGVTCVEAQAGGV